MDPSDNHNEDKGNRREDRRRLRMVKVERGGTARQRYGASRRTSSADGEGNARPEEAPSNRRAMADPPPAAAVAAAAARNNNHNSSDEENPNSDAEDDRANPKLRELVQHLKEFCRDGGTKSPHASAINMEKARNVLEACAGNVPLAGQLYWDDYFATQQQQHNNPPPLDAPSAASDAAAAAPAPEEEEEEEVEEDPEEDRRVRRRLESDFDRYLPPAAEAAPPPPARAARRRRRRRRPEAEGEIAILAARNNVEEDVPMEDAEPPPPAVQNAPPPRRPQQQQQQQQQQDNQALLVAARAVLGAGGEDAGESVSVSDDETGVAGVLRMVRESGRARFRSRRRRRSSSFDDDSGLIRARNVFNAQFQSSTEKAAIQAKMKSAAGAGGDGGGGGSDSDEDSKKEDSDDDSAYLSDNDWLFTHTRVPTTAPSSPAPSTTQTENLRAPLSVLWKGLSTDNTKGSSNDKKTKKDDTKKEKDQEDGKKTKREVKKEEENVGDGDNNEPPLPGAAKRPEIPSTWLHASFSPHSSGMGLSIKQPKPEDVVEHSWKLKQISNEGSLNNNPRRNNSIPLPYHCRGQTAILSIVTAAMYTGASVQSNQVTCSSSRVPFLELSEEDKRREFESRLIDALSAIIFIAAKASMERKKKALAKRQARRNRKRKRQAKEKKSGEEKDTTEADTAQRNLERKLKLCPVVWWKETQQNAPIMPAEQWESSLEDGHTGPRIQLSITGTNISDIRAFVLSNMQSFTAPGGLALFLETVVGIHGEGAMKRMLKRCNKGNCKDRYLVRCTCEARQKKRLQDPSLSPSERRKMTNALDTTPPGYSCVSAELISLLLTGKVQSSMKGWTAGPLGFGFLTNKHGEVGRALTRPELPVWCVRGETCYSVLLLDYTNHGDNLDEKVTASTSKGKTDEKKKKSWSPSKPKGAPCMKISVCSSTSRSRDLQDARAFANQDQPGYVANMMHWNTWYLTRNLSSLRMITQRKQWTAPAPSWVVANYRSAPNAKHGLSLTTERRTVTQQLKEKRAAQATVVSSDDADEGQPVDDAAMENVRHNPEDAEFYPKQHRLWRFDMGERDGDKVDPNSKPRGDHWVPYHSLSREDQMIVETKFGPQINRILWTRWRGATIDKFRPEGKKEPLPIV